MRFLQDKLARKLHHRLGMRLLMLPWCGVLLFASCYESHVVETSRDGGERDAVVTECPVRVTHEARFVPDLYTGDAYSPVFAAFPDGDLAVTFAGRDMRSPYVTYIRMSASLEPRTPQRTIPSHLYLFGYPVVHTGAPYVMVDETLVSLDEDGEVLDTYTAAPEVDGIDWLSPANDGFLVAIHTGGVRLVYIGLDGTLRSVVDTEDARRVMSRPPIARPGGRAHVFAYLRHSNGPAVLREVSEEGLLGPPAEFPAAGASRVGLAAMGRELWLVQIADTELVVYRTDASTFELIEEHRLDALPEARTAANLDGRLIVVSSRPGDDRVWIDDFGPDLSARCRLQHRLDGSNERIGHVSLVETDGAVVIGGETQTDVGIRGWAARLATR